MSSQHFDDFGKGVEEYIDSQEAADEINLKNTKLERRRRIEDLFEERRLREELEEFA